MAAIITDQIRILNAKNFVAGVSTSTNSYYSFVGLTDPTAIQSDWDTDPPSPIDNFTNHKQQITYVKDRPGHDHRYAINPSKLKKDLINVAGIKEFKNKYKCRPPLLDNTGINGNLYSCIVSIKNFLSKSS